SSGYADVAVDQFPWGTVDTYASPAQDRSLILSINGLTQASHSLTVKVIGLNNGRATGNRVWIDGFNVIGGPAPTPTPTPDPTPTPTPAPTATTRIEDVDLVSVG